MKLTPVVRRNVYSTGHNRSELPASRCTKLPCTSPVVHIPNTQKKEIPRFNNVHCMEFIYLVFTGMPGYVRGNLGLLLCLVTCTTSVLAVRSLCCFPVSSHEDTPAWGSGSKLLQASCLAHPATRTESNIPCHPY